jgi:hypothetical protein
MLLELLELGAAGCPRLTRKPEREEKLSQKMTGEIVF